MKAVFLDVDTIDSTVDLTVIETACQQLTTYGITLNKDIIARAQNADIIITNKVPLSAETLAQLPKLKLVCVAATGMNNVDLQAAHTRGVVVTNVVGYAKHAVAQYIFAFLLAQTNKTAHYMENQRQGKWQNSPTFCLADSPINDLSRMTLGLVGYGAIAQQVHQIALAFSMQVLIAERPNADKVRTGRLPFNEVLAASDVISLHCPLTAETENLFNQSQIEQMKQGSILINTARGAIVNNQDLINALNSGKLAHAIIDVLDQEPPPANHPLIVNQPKNLTLTAHIAWASLAAQQTLINEIANNINRFIKDIH